MKLLKPLRAGIAAAVMLAATSAQAVIDIGDPVEGGSWEQMFNQSSGDIGGSAFTRMDLIMYSPGDSFESPWVYSFSQPGWSATSVSTTYLIASRTSSSTSVNFTVKFAGTKANALDFYVYTWNGTALVGNERAHWSGSAWSFDKLAPIPAVPEPGTILAGALLLLPFAASTIRRFRKTS